MGGMLCSSGQYILEVFESECNVPRHGQVGSVIVLIPLEVDAAVYCSVPIRGACL